MTLSEEFIESICDDELQKKIILVLRDNSKDDFQKIEYLVKYLRGESND